MNINPDHVEFAVVERLKLLLSRARDSEFSVTHTYSLFVPIVCWTVQRMRSPVSDEATRLFESLGKENLSDKCWGIQTNSNVIPFKEALPVRVGPFTDFDDRSVAQFWRTYATLSLTAMRGACDPFPSRSATRTASIYLGSSSTAVNSKVEGQIRK